MSAEVLSVPMVQMVGDGSLWVPEFLRLIVITAGCYWARQCSRGVAGFTLIYSSQQPSGMLLLTDPLYRLNKDPEWLPNLPKITQPEVVESRFEPRVSGSRAAILAALCDFWITPGHLVPRLPSEPSFSLCFVWFCLVMIERALKHRWDKNG